MKDFKAFRYYSPTAYSKPTEVRKFPGNGLLQESKELEEAILPYLHAGYRIVQITGDMGDCNVFLQKD